MDLKNLTMDDLKEKFAAFDRKTLIKSGIGIGCLLYTSPSPRDS